jgi:DNA-binding winged helix-turn-helix (wHTH) protein
MLASIDEGRVLRSAGIAFDKATRQLRVEGRLVALGGLPLRILEQLISADGRLVTRAELKQRLWPYAARIDTERRLNTAVRALRQALGDTAAEPRLILTVRGHGYRWIGVEREARHKRDLAQTLLQAASLAGLCFLAPAAATAPRPSPPSTTIAAANTAVVRDWDWPDAERLYRRALVDSSDSAAAHRGLAWLYVNAGREDAALPHIAALLEASDHADRAELGWLLLRAGQPQAALALCNASAGASLNLLSCRQTALARLGLVAEAQTVAVAVMRTAAADSKAIAAVADAPAKIGYARFLRWRVGHFLPPTGQWFQRAQLEAEAGLYRDALASLDKAMAARDPLLVKIASTPEFMPLRGTADFRRIEDRVFARARWS